MSDILLSLFPFLLRRLRSFLLNLVICLFLIPGVSGGNLENEKYYMAAEWYGKQCTAIPSYHMLNRALANLTVVQVTGLLEWLFLVSLGCLAHFYLSLSAICQFLCIDFEFRTSYTTRCRLSSFALHTFMVLFSTLHRFTLRAVLLHSSTFLLFQIFTECYKKRSITLCVFSECSFVLHFLEIPFCCLFGGFQ